jgi:hypothetical protein
MNGDKGIDLKCKRWGEKWAVKLGDGRWRMDENLWFWGEQNPTVIGKWAGGGVNGGSQKVGLDQ